MDIRRGTASTRPGSGAGPQAEYGPGSESGPGPGPTRGFRLRLPRTRAGQRRLVWGAAAGCVLALLPSAWLFVSTADRLRSTADAPRTEVAVVFGAGLDDGKPSRYLAGRLRAAADLYREGRVKVVLVTGDNSRDDYDEPDAMRVYLRAHGVPDRQVVADYAGFDTWDSCVRARKIFGVDRAVLISQGFHIRRTVALCEAAGIDSYGVGVSDRHDVTWYYGGTREVFAAGKAALDAAFQPDPHFLGHREPGVARALESAGHRGH